MRTRNPAPPRPRRRAGPAWIGTWVLLLAGLLVAPATRGAERDPVARILSTAGTVEVLPAGASAWSKAGPEQVLYAGDRVRTGPRSRAKLELPDRPLDLAERSQLEIVGRPGGVLLELVRGLLYFFHRGRPGQVDFKGGGLHAAVKGTEFALQVAESGAVTLTLFDGLVETTDARGNRAEFRSGDVVTARPGESPRRTAVVTLRDTDAVAWALYYPAILDPSDLGWTTPPDPGLAASWEHFRRGHLPRALDQYPTDRIPATPGERLYLAALLLASGSVEESARHLDAALDEPSLRPLVEAQRRLIGVVRRTDPGPAATSASAPATATEALAESYVLQSGKRLAEARDTARRATMLAAGSGLAWARLAELEFSFGDARAAEQAVTRALERMPDHAEAHALRGFILAARHRVADAEAAFQHALALDGALGNAWLGRGLCRIRRGDLAAGRADLLVAAAAEPQRSLLRSYLAKALADGGFFGRDARPDDARHELELARVLDPADPTPALYGALLDQRENRIHDALDQLDASRRLVGQRALYRSGLLLDQDAAVRGANLAAVHADAGFADRALREASRAVNLDDGSAAAHLFLANAYDALRDPRQIDLRHETPWFGEYLLANLLGPVGVGALSPVISRHEYSRLFERDRFGLVNRTTWTSRGDGLQQTSQFGQQGRLAYSLDVAYRTEDGEGPNRDLEQLTLQATAKIQAGPSDSLFVQGIHYDAESGDVLRRYDPSATVPGLRLEERQEPIVLAGHHHEWHPGSHTLFLVVPWRGSHSFRNPSNEVLTVVRDAAGAVNSATFDPAPLTDYRARLAGISVEAQHRWQTERQTLVAGARFQTGGFDTAASLDLSAYSPDPSPMSRADPGFERVTLHAYDHWRLGRAILLTVGVAYDRLQHPVNFRAAPLLPGETEIERVSPKVGLTMTPWTGTTLRAAYARALGGVAYDQSFRLEPVQVAGFTQAYRGLIPESMVGSVAGQDMEILGLAWDQDLPGGTWFTLAAEQLRSDADRDIGAFEFDLARHLGTGAWRQHLDFTERSLALSAGHWVARDWAVHARYRLTESELVAGYPGLPAGSPFFPQQRQDWRAVLQQVVLGLRYHHPSGLFASWESRWTWQAPGGDVAALPTEAFWQHDAWIGWRFRQRRAEVAAGVLNLTDQDYRLFPVNPYLETYRERTAAVTLRFQF